MRPETIEVTAQRLQRLGYDCVEILYEPSVYQQGAAVKRILDRYGIECWAGIGLMQGERDLLHDDPFLRRGAVAYLAETIDFVAEAGGTVVTVIPSALNKLVPRAGPSSEWDWAVESLQIAQQHARDRGVTIGIEAISRFETYFINRADQALALAADVGFGCGVVLDTFHLNVEEADWEQAILTAAPRLVSVHVGDNNRHAPGSGSFDWGRLFEVLDRAGYDGCICVEFDPPTNRTPVGTPIESGSVPDAVYDTMAQASASFLRPLIERCTG